MSYIITNAVAILLATCAGLGIGLLYRILPQRQVKRSPVALLITAAVNVPLNDQLARGGADPAQLRAHFERSWVVWNVLRAIAATASFGSLITAVRAL